MQADSLTHSKVGRAEVDIYTNHKEKLLEMLKEVGLEGRLEGGKGGSPAQEKRESVPDGPDGWAKGGEVWSKECAGRESQKWNVECERVCRGGASWRGRREQSC